MNSFYVVISFLLFQNCIYTTVANQFIVPVQNSSKEKIRVIALIKGNACVEVCSLKDKSPFCKDKGENSCKNFAIGWYPLEFARDEKYFRTSSSYPPKKIKFIYNLSSHLIKKYGEGIHGRFQYIPVQSIEELGKAYPKGQFKNALVVKLLDFGRETHWSGVASMSTLLLFPGYYKEFIDMEISFFNHEGKPSVINSNLPYLKHWMGWIFILWGPIFSNNEKDLFSKTIESLLGE